MSFDIPMRSDSKKEKITHSVCVGGPMTLHTIDGVIRRVRPIVLTDDDPAGWVILSPVRLSVFRAPTARRPSPPAPPPTIPGVWSATRSPCLSASSP